MTGDEDAIIQGSDNIFADLGLPNPEEHLVKARLASTILDGIESRGWTQVQAAAELGISQPDVSRITNGLVREYSVERLLQLLRRLGFQVTIHIEGRDQPSVNIQIPLHQ
jgi:predicted XRE-type DNA-binding protein